MGAHHRRLRAGAARHRRDDARLRRRAGGELVHRPEPRLPVVRVHLGRRLVPRDRHGWVPVDAAGRRRGTRDRERVGVHARLPVPGARVHAAHRSAVRVRRGLGVVARRPRRRAGVPPADGPVPRPRAGDVRHGAVLRRTGVGGVPGGLRGVDGPVPAARRAAAHGGSTVVGDAARRPPARHDPTDGARLRVPGGALRGRVGDPPGVGALVGTADPPPARPTRGGRHGVGSGRSGVAGHRVGGHRRAEGLHGHRARLALVVHRVEGTRAVRAVGAGVRVVVRAAGRDGAARRRAHRVRRVRVHARCAPDRHRAATLGRGVPGVPAGGVLPAVEHLAHPRADRAAARHRGAAAVAGVPRGRRRRVRRAAVGLAVLHVVGRRLRLDPAVIDAEHRKARGSAFCGASERHIRHPQPGRFRSCPLHTG
ncbi:hypothetical protein CURTO8I2_220263 [Curtobacterium sp. 8I-2]|nr:hypothetical protein CURTO8I2_220263 [Curtobacterium sp. 8I-2]